MRNGPDITVVVMRPTGKVITLSRRQLFTIVVKAVTLLMLMIMTMVMHTAMDTSTL